MNKLIQLIKDEEGATMAEYALLLGLVVVAIATTVATFRGNIVAQFDRAGGALAPQ